MRAEFECSSGCTLTSILPALRIERDYFWAKVGRARLFSVVHKPAEQRSTGTGVVLCQSVGHEYVHSYRSMRVLADTLADAGMYVLRFDYEGTGNSSGCGTEPGLVTRWQDSIVVQAQGFVEKYGLKNLHLVAFRIGAYLAAPAIGRIETSSVVLWAPPTGIRQYLRGLHALSRLAEYPQLADDQLESAGFVYTDDLMKGLRRLEEYRDSPKADTNLLILDSDDGSKAPEPGFTQAQRQHMSAGELQEMLYEPHLSKVPANSIGTISQWLLSAATRDAGGTQVSSFSPGSVAGLDVTANDEFTETIVSDTEKSLVGVFCEPAARNWRDSSVIVMPNAGSVHSIGPNRVYTLLARALARAGFASFRFDLRNLGESASIDVEQENHPYPRDAVMATRDALDLLATKYMTDSFVLAGLCSGSFTAFQYVLTEEDDRVTNLWMINPLTFHWEDGMPLRLGAGQASIENSKYYGRAVVDPERWRHLLSGKAEYRAIVIFIARSGIDWVRKKSRRLMDAAGVTAATPLAIKLQRIADRNIPVTFFFASRDLGYELLRDEALSAERRLRRLGHLQYVFIDNADHTFTRSKEREDFVDSVISHAKTCLK